MLDKINNNISETISQSKNLDRITGLGATNPYEENEKNFFIDESHISQAAIKKYQREIDVKSFSKILNETDEKESTNLVVQKAFNGLLSVDNDEILSELINNKDFLNDIK